MAIVVNKPLPEFEANATGGIKVSNTSHLGQIVILYFYPKDNTPGCTTEAMQFRDKYKDFAKAGAAVFGVSRDNMKSHDEFKEKLELPFELIADTEEKMCHMFGVVKNKIMYGKKVKGIERSTFLIGADGLLKEEWRGLKVPGRCGRRIEGRKGTQENRSPRLTSRWPRPTSGVDACKVYA
jgi:Peroxiredoxin